METRSTKQKLRETEEQEKIQILQEEELEVLTKVEERKHTENSKAIINNTRKNEKWEKKYVEVDSKMEEIQEQVDNNSGEINGIYGRLREQGTKLINVEAKINQHKEERIRVCEDSSQSVCSRVTNLFGDAIIREAMRGATETWYRTKVGEYRNFKQFRKEFMKNYWGTKKESVMKSELYGTKFSHSLMQLEEKLDKSTVVHILAGQFEEEIHNKDMIDETKNFDDLVKILTAHDRCKKDRKSLMETNIIMEVIIIITNTGNTTTADKKGIILIILRDLTKGINFIVIT
ncbi:hypothetical protein FQA39_LY13447 [Lamprigera yunnana]|nr:hypothetical protein FQA39_LY13447 [Lamprigera yunnana]